MNTPRLKNTRNGYRPSDQDFFPLETKQLSCREGGKHDRERFGIFVDGEWRRIDTCQWTKVCREQHQAGIKRGRQQ